MKKTRLDAQAECEFLIATTIGKIPIHIPSQIRIISNILHSSVPFMPFSRQPFGKLWHVPSPALFNAFRIFTQIVLYVLFNIIIRNSYKLLIFCRTICIQNGEFHIMYLMMHRVWVTKHISIVYITAPAPLEFYISV